MNLDTSACSTNNAKYVDQMIYTVFLKKDSKFALAIHEFLRLLINRIDNYLKIREKYDNRRFTISSKKVYKKNSKINRIFFF